MDFKKNRLKELCKCNHITQEKLAEDLGVDSRTVRRWMNSTPSRGDILILADYFDILPFELFGDFEDAVMPEFKIESSGSIDYVRIRREVLCSLNILAEDNGLIDIYRNIYVEFSEEMKESLLDISLKITNIYSRLIYTMSTKEWRHMLSSQLPDTDDDNYYLYLRSYTIGLFHPSQGFLNSSEVTNVMDEMCCLCHKYKPNPLYPLILPTNIETFLLNIYLLGNRTPINIVQQYMVCLQIFLELLSIIGDIRPHKKTQYICQR